MKLRWLVTIGAALMLALGGTAVVAQVKGTDHEEAIHAKMAAMHQALQDMLVKIGASEAQSNRIFDIRQRYEHEKLHLNLAEAPKDQVKLRMKALHDEAVKAIANVLGPVQIEKLHTVGGIPALLGEGEAGSPWDILRKLDLSVEQKIQVKQIIAGVEASMDLIKQDRSLSGQQVKTKMVELHHKVIAQVEAILTPAQQSRLHELMEEHPKARVINP
jgi:Spy/CpxP family protein refolding chaperone